MKFFVAFILTALLSFACSLFFPWWTIAVASFTVAIVIHQRPIASFLAGFLALFILWISQSFIIDLHNEHLLSTRVASILPFGGSYAAVIIFTGLVGGVVSGMAALTASFVKKRTRKKVVAVDRKEM
jgi:hypothetical protein